MDVLEPYVRAVLAQGFQVVQRWSDEAGWATVVLERADEELSVWLRSGAGKVSLEAVVSEAPADYVPHEPAELLVKDPTGRAVLLRRSALTARRAETEVLHFLDGVRSARQELTAEDGRSA